MLPSKLKLVYCHNSSEISSNLLLKVEVYYFKVTSILERVCDVVRMTIHNDITIQAP